MAATPQIEARDARPYAAIARSLTMAELGQVLPPLNDEVFGWLEDHGGVPAGPPFWRYRVIDMARELQVEVGSLTTATLPGDDDVVTGELPAGRYAVVRHVGHPDSLMQATADLLAWAEREGLTFDRRDGDDGDVWAARLEFYETDPDEEPDLDRWVTRLEFRLAD